MSLIIEAAVAASVVSAIISVGTALLAKYKQQKKSGSEQQLHQAEKELHNAYVEMKSLENNDSVNHMENIELILNDIKNKFDKKHVEQLMKILVPGLKDIVVQRTEELRAADQLLENKTHIDPLTLVANRRAFQEYAENEVAWTQRSGRPFAFIYADLDHFKMINDTFGHACGDFVLKEVAATLVKNLRATDLIVRFGGDEFVFILRETDEPGAVVFAEKFRRLIEQQRYTYGGMELGVTMTFGVSEYQSWMTIQKCMSEADLANFEGKKGGGNTVVARSKSGNQQNQQVYKE